MGTRLREDPVLFLQGMGGIGKSEIARGYAQQYRDRYDVIIFASYTSSLLELVNSDEIAVENLRRGAGADGETPEEFFARKMQIIRSISSPRTLLIIEEASRQYLELELSLEQDFGEQNPQVLRLRRKRLEACGNSLPAE